MEPPSACATSRGGIPPRRSCCAEAILLGVIRRFRPTTRPRLRAARMMCIVGVNCAPRRREPLLHFPEHGAALSGPARCNPEDTGFRLASISRT